MVWLLLAVAGVELAPTVCAIRPLRLRILPGLSGRGDPDHVALSFDDGPDPVTTPQLLDQLARLGVHATFFVVGERVRRHPDLVARMSSEGHEIAAHCDIHRAHLLRSPISVRRDVRTIRRQIRVAHAEAPRFWRPPHGIPTATGIATAARMGMRPTLWTADGADWQSRRSLDRVQDRVAGQLHGGGVVLLHEGVRGTEARTAADVVPWLVDRCTARGWRIGPLGEHGLRIAAPVGVSG